MAYSRPGVYITETLLPGQIATVGTANAAGAAVGVFAQGPTTVTLVTSWYDFVKKFGGYNAAFPATFGVGQFFQNGGSELYVRRVLHSDATQAAIIVPHTSGGSDAVATVTAKSYGADGNNLRVQFTSTGRANYYDLTVYKETVAGTGSNVANDLILERYTNVVTNDTASSDFVATVVNVQSQYISIAVTDTTATPTTAVLPLVGGSDGSAATASDFGGVLAEFDAVDRPLVIFAPEVLTQLGTNDGATVHDSLIAWANTGSGYAVIDTPAITNQATAVADAISYAGDRTTPVTGQAAAYFPNYYITDPVGRSAQSLRKVGPAGAVAGLYISTDKQVGPFKAPAGIRSAIRGAVALEKSFTSAELDTLNSGFSPVNAIRNLPGSGIVVMGARTLQQDGTVNKYVNMRRSLIYIEKRLKDATQFAIFENNNEVLWARLNSTIGSILNEYRNQGGLRGATARQAFFVKIDKENNPAETIANGEVHIEVGVALQYPAEFVVINLSQKTAN
jgi:phage tail sheath protein FI